MLGTAERLSAPGVPAKPKPSTEPAKVWLVEARSDRESYSNGLQIDLSAATTNRKRLHVPSGIVYHTTESQLADFDSSQNRRLQHLGKALLDYVRDERGYHYVIDRFGRVFRVVAEDDIAFHAGNSVWADPSQTYVNLNGRFLAVAIESATRPGDDPAAITRAQVQSTRLLTEMLRSRYRIAATNCVTHAQVSVNPSNYRVGWHTDWAGNFPFEEIGLPDNYEQPLPAIERFGFGYDAAFFAATGARMWRGVVAAEDNLRARAAREGIAISELKASLRREYQREIKNQENQP